VVKIEYNKEVLSYQDILNEFWNLHDSTVPQTAQYKSAIFAQSEEQQKAAEAAIAERCAKATEAESAAPVTEVLPPEESTTFNPAEWYHQNYKLKRGLQLLGLGLVFFVSTLNPFWGKDMLLTGVRLVLLASFLPQIVSVFDTMLAKVES